MNTISVRFDVLQAYADKTGVDYNDLCRLVRDAIADGSMVVNKVAVDIAKWFINGDRPDEWKLKEWATLLDRDAITKAFEDKVGLPTCGNREGPGCRCIGGLPAIAKAPGGAA